MAEHQPCPGKNPLYFKIINVSVPEHLTGLASIDSVYECGVAAHGSLRFHAPDCLRQNRALRAMRCTICKKSTLCKWD
ncbi:hypothetical protein NSU_pLA1156 (plasmid) [Novosphingobium pentaromativorans US6-1]|uniref:Uncharacterized protein n=1 Tax=Novosphingobium pentaromativorans US6-1 TaxID=1088721 RepID=G6EL82_9SPHN|nr:L469 [uncultured bacterium]EHJ58050.1 hypothetical protein NSU_pLA1156 [Novosphingobium pentaromativorans US6-1]